MRFINEPKIFVNPVRDLLMFDNQYLEPLSKCPWQLPIIFWSLYIYSWVPDLGDIKFLHVATIIAGINCFFFVEYVLHRFLFHGENGWMQIVPANNYFFLLHFILHGIHHAFPQDKHRLVLPPILGYFYYVVMFKVPFECMIPSHLLPSWMIGFAIGYLMYELTHYFIHHSNPPAGSYF